MRVEMKPLVQINQDAMQILYKELGLVNTLRFLRQFSNGYGDFVKEREELFKGMSIDDIVADARRLGLDKPRKLVDEE